MTVLRAKFVAPMHSPLIADGAVVIDDGRIEEVGSFDASSFAQADIQDLGDVVLLPGLINAHTHLELSHARPGEPPASFGEWLLRVVSQRVEITAEQVAAATADGVAECLKFGVTTVGDITRDPSITRPVCARSPLKVVSLGEVRAMGTRRGQLESKIASANASTSATPSLAAGISPHAPYSVEPDGYRACVRVTIENEVVFSTHLAESPEETEFLNHHRGPLRDLWDAIGGWDEAIPKFSGSPVEFAAATGVLNIPSLLAHVNYASDADLDLLAASPASVVWCPRTHAYFGHSPHRWREMLARGINVCVGTDSRASSPDLNIVDDLRLVHRQSPEVPVETLWEMVTTRAARGLRRADVGAIAAGMRADFVTFPMQGREPLRELLENEVLPRAVIVGGRVVHL